MDVTKKIQSLDLLKCRESGLVQVLEEDASELNFKRFFEDLVMANFQKLNTQFEQNPQLINTAKIKALYLLNLILQEKQLSNHHISIRPAQEYVLDALAFELIEVYSAWREATKCSSKEINFYEYLGVLPSLVIYYSDYLLKDYYWKNSGSTNQVLERVWVYLSNQTEYWKFMNENLNAQRHRLLALFYRRTSQVDLAELALVEYRKTFNPDLQAKIKINPMDITQDFLPAQVLNNMDNIYKEVDAIQLEILTRTGINQNTCFYFSCTDCCSKDFPTVSLLEFLYIKKWLQENNIDIKIFQDRASQVQTLHKNLFGEDLKIVDQTKSEARDENPFAYQFRCPFLGDDNSCQIHPARPLVCRAFGLATVDGNSVRACKYFKTQYQYNSSLRNEREVFSSMATTHMIGSANELLAGEHGFEGMKQPVATLVAWLTR